MFLIKPRANGMFARGIPESVNFEMNLVKFGPFFCCKSQHYSGENPAIILVDTLLGRACPLFTLIDHSSPQNLTTLPPYLP
jgi:hypothetical protein